MSLASTEQQLQQRDRDQKNARYYTIRRHAEWQIQVSSNNISTDEASTEPHRDSWTKEHRAVTFSTATGTKEIVNGTMECGVQKIIRYIISTVRWLWQEFSVVAPQAYFNDACLSYTRHIAFLFRPLTLSPLCSGFLIARSRSMQSIHVIEA